MTDQKPAVRDDRYILDVVLPRWRFDGFEFCPDESATVAGALLRCKVWWFGEGLLRGLEMGVFIDLNVPNATSGNVSLGLANLAAPYWKAEGRMNVPRVTGVLHKAWEYAGTYEAKNQLAFEPPEPLPFGSSWYRAPFEIRSRKVYYFNTGVIRLQKRIAFDLGLRNAITHTASTLRARGVEW